MLDRYDLTAILGLILIVAAVYLLADWPGLLGLVGGLLVILGVWGAQARGNGDGSAR